MNRKHIMFRMSLIASHAAASMTIWVLVSVSGIGAQAAACGSVVSGSGLLQSVNYPSAYLNSYSCSWTLQASPAGGRIYLQIQHFSTESCCDFVRIYDATGALTNSYSGSSAPPNLMLGSVATVIFTTDSSAVFSGFSILVSTIAPPPPNGVATTPCGGTVSNAAPSLLMSANYPNNYINGITCQWTILASPMCTNISLQLLYFATEQCCDFLRVENDTHQLYLFSGIVPATTMVLGREAKITFTTDGSAVSWGFMMVASSIGCTFPRAGRFSLAPTPTLVAVSAPKISNSLRGRSLIECSMQCLQKQGSCVAHAYYPMLRTCHLFSSANQLPTSDVWKRFILE